MSDAQSIISCLYLPMDEVKLLLPNVSVAEVVDYQKPQKSDESKEYYLGKVTWRGIQVPLISYELANGKKEPSPSAAARIAVINSIGDKQETLPFFAIVTQGIPRLVKVSDDIIKNARKKKGSADAAVVKVDGEDAVIPNLEYLESLTYDHI